MTRDGQRGAVSPALLLILCWLGAFALACRIEVSGAPEADAGSLLGRLLGESRTVLGRNMYFEADRYFHLGVSATKHTAFSDRLTRLAEAVEPSRHEETQGEEVREITPWLRFATQMDPHNVDAYLAASFWVAGHGGRPDVAESILMEAQRNNPRDYRVFREKATLCMRLGKWEAAGAALDSGIRLWPSSQDGEDRQVVADLIRMLDDRSVLAVRDNDMVTATKLARRALALAPDLDHLAWRVEAIEKGESMTKWADATLAGVARRYTAADEHECSREGAHEHEHEDADAHNHEHHEGCIHGLDHG
jgi:hypothetical protein